MPKLVQIAAAAVLAAAASSSAFAQGPDLSRFSAANARNDARILVLCDATEFLASRPRLEANKILARRTGRPFEMLLPPNFLVGGRFYKESYERAYFRLRQRKVIDRNQVSDLQDRLVRDYIETYRRRGPLPNRFVREQTKFCYGWLRSQGVSPSL